MKKATRILMAAFVMAATFGFASCGDDTKDNPDPQPGQTYEESASYSILFNGNAVAAGSTVESEEGFKVDLLLANKTDGALGTRFKVEKVSGPDAMNKIGVCIDVCTDQNCPYTSPNLNIAAGGQQYISIEYLSERATSMTATYKLTVGEGLALNNPQVIFVKLNVN